MAGLCGRGCANWDDGESHTDDSSERKADTLGEYPDRDRLFRHCFCGGDSRAVVFDDYRLSRRIFVVCDRVSEGQEYFLGAQEMETVLVGR